MSENEETRKILHRVVFYDLLSTPDIEHQRDTYDRIHEAHLSIPLMPGLETVWAPNGYGKTFAMQMLERMWKPTQYSSDQWTTRGGVHWLSDFLRECQAMVLDISDSPTSQKIGESRFHHVEELSKDNWTPVGVQRMVPFSLMMARIVELDSNDQIQEVSDLWIKPNWKNFVTHDIEVEVSRIPMFANYESKMKELLGEIPTERRRYDQYILDQLDWVDEEARLFITERDSWKKESSLLEKAGLDISKFIEDTENEYWNPVIPSTFVWEKWEGNWEGLVYPEEIIDGSVAYWESHNCICQRYQRGHFRDDGEWISGDSTGNRRPPVPFEIAKGSSIQLEMSKETNSLMEVLRTTKVDYVEIPKESLEFFEDPDRATQKVTEITNNLDTSKIQMIEDKINDVLRMKGNSTDPWSRKVSLSESTSIHKYRHGVRLWGPYTSNTDFENKKHRISRLQHKGPELDIKDKEYLINTTINAKRLFVTIPSNYQSLIKNLEENDYQMMIISALIRSWKKVLAKAETNVVRYTQLEGEVLEYENLVKERHLLENQLKTVSETNPEELKSQQQIKNKLKDVLNKMQYEMEAMSATIVPQGRALRAAKQQLALVAEILNEHQIALAFYDMSSLILKKMTLEGVAIPDERQQTLSFLHNQISHLDQFRTWGLEQETLEQYQTQPKYRNKTMFEAYMSELNRMKDSLEKQRETRFEVESPYRNTPLRKDVLSFGQKSTILTELYLGTFEALSAPSSDIGEGSFNENRYCLIIDEPEVGRSEYSLDHLIKRLIWSKTTHDAELNNSVVVLSHRNKLLKQVSGKYHLLQPVDIGYQTEEE